MIASNWRFAKTLWYVGSSNLKSYSPYPCTFRNGLKSVLFQNRTVFCPEIALKIRSERVPGTHSGNKMKFKFCSKAVPRTCSERFESGD